jgi:hypothetical protein
MFDDMKSARGFSSNGRRMEVALSRHGGVIDQHDDDNFVEVAELKMFLGIPGWMALRRAHLETFERAFARATPAPEIK